MDLPESSLSSAESSFVAAAIVPANVIVNAVAAINRNLRKFTDDLLIGNCSFMG